MLEKEKIINFKTKFLNDERLKNELSANTLKTYNNSINKFIQYLNNLSINRIDKQIMINYKNYLNEISGSSKTKNLWITVINKYLKYLNCKELCLKKIKVQNKFYLKNVLTLADYKRLLRIAKRENMIQDYMIIQTLAKTGIRISELKYFTVDNLKKSNRNIIMISSKGKERDIEIPTKLGTDLRKYARENKLDGYIFTQINNKNKLLNPSTFWKHLQKIAGIARVNKDKCHAHNFRHLFSIEFLKEHNNNSFALASLLGHSSLNTTRIYQTFSPDEKRAMLDKMKL